MWDTPDLEDGQVKREEEPPLALARLRLTTAELETLRRQGAVARERRGRRWLYKLRFRVDGRQVTRYVGTDAGKAAEVRQGLREWQVGRHLDLALGRLARQAGRELRRAKQELEKQMAERGLGFHGLAVRRPRLK